MAKKYVVEDNSRRQVVTVKCDRRDAERVAGDYKDARVHEVDEGSARDLERDIDRRKVGEWRREEDRRSQERARCEILGEEEPKYEQ